MQYVDVDGMAHIAQLAECDLQAEARRQIGQLQENRAALHESAARAARAEVS